MNNLSWFKPWTPLSKYQKLASKVGENIHRIAPSTFIYTVDYNRELIEDSDAPYATVLIFSPSLGAAERSINQSIESDSLEPLNFEHIPDVGITDWSYSNLSKLPSIFEYARYSRGNGQFIEVSLEWQGFEFCFREQNLQPVSKPYLVKYSPNA